ncbi:FecR domain-containing protein [Candidatus Omnitrophota bacterium]
MRTVITIVLLLGMLMVISGSPVSSQPHTDVVIAVILRTEGTVLYKESESDRWFPAREKQRITVEDSLKTEESSSAVIHFTATGSRVFVNENTELGITALLSSNGRPLIDRVVLIKGEIYSRIKNTSHCEIKTPYCLITSKGGEFSTQYDDEKTIVFAVSGTVDISNKSGKITLKQNYKTTVMKDANLSRPIWVPEKERKDFWDWVN